MALNLGPQIGDVATVIVDRVRQPKYNIYDIRNVNGVNRVYASFTQDPNNTEVISQTPNGWRVEGYNNLNHTVVFNPANQPRRPWQHRRYRNRQPIHEHVLEEEI